MAAGEPPPLWLPTVGDPVPLTVVSHSDSPEPSTVRSHSGSTAARRSLVATGVRPLTAPVTPVTHRVCRSWLHSSTVRHHHAAPLQRPCIAPPVATPPAPPAALLMVSSTAPRLPPPRLPPPARLRFLPAQLPWRPPCHLHKLPTRCPCKPPPLSAPYTAAPPAPPGSASSALGPAALAAPRRLRLSLPPGLDFKAVATNFLATFQPPLAALRHLPRGHRDSHQRHVSS
ncbi:uncharacterized protein LOC131876759 [Cryptomeria japonica]|uniref:uncharacterized protein LOC131876759 n=1 Tax=Cryptomeria japonica TaxID=3369 RepID=UPI0027DAB4DB|nr:uncharacterized protein LOC131876759 [Cryptomeria japonica]